MPACAQAFMLRKVESEPLARVASVVADTLERCTHKGILTASQRLAVTAELAAALHPVL